MPENYNEMSADQILAKVIADGKVDEYEVSALADKLNQDWVVDRDEIELLFRVNHALNEKDEDCPQWVEFFVDNVSRLLIMDLDTPGEIDQAEGDWLADILDKHQVGNLSEQKLMNEIRDNCQAIAGRIQQRFSGNVS